MRVGVIGSGSMGNKHIKHLLDMNHEVVVCEINPGRLDRIAEEFNIDKCYVDYVNMGNQEYMDAVIISTDTAFHAQIACFFAEKGIAYFSEIPIGHSLRDLHALSTATIANNVVSMVGMVWRFHPAIQKIKQLVDEGRIGKVNTASVYGGEYLPDWHPDKPYKREYSALREKGGGVILTNISGVDYLRYFFGDVENAFAVYDSISHIQIEAEDFSMKILQFQNGVFAQLYSDFFQRPTEHRIDIIGETGKIRWDHQEKVVKVYDYAAGAHGKWEEYGYELDDFRTLYNAEIKHFLSCVDEKKETFISVSDNVKTVAVADALKRSFVERRFVNVRSLFWGDHLH